MKTAILLSGSGVYDGSEIHESVMAMLSLSQNNIDYICTAPDINQHHVINHMNGEETSQQRNVLHESARIARGQIVPLSELKFENISSLVIVGGFGAAKNLSNWAFKGPNGDILEEIKDLILYFIKNKKPIVALCISPILIAKSTEGTKYCPKITLGSEKENSEYNISEINQVIKSIGSIPENRNINEICVDTDLRIITAPCYMMNANIDEIYLNTKMAIDTLVKDFLS